MKKYFIITSIVLLSAACNKAAPVSPVQNQPTQNQSRTSTPLALPIKYNNTKYGFIFSLPQTWKGYSVNESIWQSNPDEANATQSGPFISIKHPLSTSQNPRQDIPILIFTLKQWDDVQEGKFHIGAAPIGPTELGRNSKYVFALPARYNYSFATGYEEVEKIIDENPLQAY